MNQEEKVELIDGLISNPDKLTFWDLEEIAKGCQQSQIYVNKQKAKMKKFGFPVKSKIKLPISSILRLYSEGDNKWRFRLV